MSNCVLLHLCLVLTLDSSLYSSLHRPLSHYKFYFPVDVSISLALSHALSLCLVVWASLSLCGAHPGGRPSGPLLFRQAPRVRQGEHHHHRGVPGEGGVHGAARHTARGGSEEPRRRGEGGSDGITNFQRDRSRTAAAVCFFRPELWSSIASAFAKVKTVHIYCTKAFLSFATLRAFPPFIRSLFLSVCLSFYLSISLSLSGLPVLHYLCVRR